MIDSRAKGTPMTKQDVIEHFGSASNVARALQISRAAVSSWPEDIPLLRQLQVEKLTGGKLKAPHPLATAA